MAVSEIVNSDELRDLYPIIETGIAAINRRQSPTVKVGRIAPDVYHKILNGEVKFLVLHSDEKVLGWCTCYVNDRTGICEDMYIAPYADKHYILEFVDTLEKFVQVDGAKELVFTSTRRAWGRKLGKQGYQLQCYVFGKEF